MRTSTSQGSDAGGAPTERFFEVVKHLFADWEQLYPEWIPDEHTRPPMFRDDTELLEHRNGVLTAKELFGSLERVVNGSHTHASTSLSAPISTSGGTVSNVHAWKSSLTTATAKRGRGSLTHGELNKLAPQSGYMKIERGWFDSGTIS